MRSSSVWRTWISGRVTRVSFFCKRKFSRVASNFFATGGPIQVSGSADGSLIGMTVALTAQFASTIDGQMAVQVVRSD